MKDKALREVEKALKKEWLDIEDIIKLSKAMINIDKEIGAGINSPAYIKRIMKTLGKEIRRDKEKYRRMVRNIKDKIRADIRYIKLVERW